MDQKDIASGFKKEPTVIEKIGSWIRRHIHFATGRHGTKSAEIGFKIEF